MKRTSITLSLSERLGAQIDLRSSVYKSRTKMLLTHLGHYSEILAHGVSALRATFSATEMPPLLTALCEFPLEAFAFTFSAEEFFSRCPQARVALGEWAERMVRLPFSAWFVFREIRAILEETVLLDSQLTSFYSHILDVLSEAIEAEGGTMLSSASRT